MVEPRRKHGGFDPRYPLLVKRAAPTWVLRADRGLEWTAFVARFFPGGRRHDIEALAAYGAYRNAPRQPSVPEYPSPAPASRARAAATTRGPKRLQPGAAKTRPIRANAPSASLSVWEGEGGAG